MRIFQKVVSVVLVLAFMLPTSLVLAEDFTRGITFAQAKNYYVEGQYRAKREYTGGGAMAGGFLAGVSLGIIGWGIGYMIVSGWQVDVPGIHLRNLNRTNRMEFEDGYSNYVKITRKGRFNVGAGLGTLLIVLLVLASGGQ
ncbi:MAG: hypothetical protein HOC71_10550 [Candidatus Latescibacteria bacterium]|jgi:hypothetical protein|nr:hypothetical protein [Candidatus Latescibacterota bacterium]